MTAPTFKKATNANTDPTDAKYGAPDIKYAFDVLDGTHATDRVQVANIENAASTNSAQSITGAKTFDSSAIKVKAPASSNAYTIVSSAIAANRNLTLPLLTGNDTAVTEAHTQTLTNKTMDYASNTFQNFPTGITASSTDTLTNKTMSYNDNTFTNFPTYVTASGSDTLTNKTIAYADNTLTNVASLNTAQTFTTAAKTFNNTLLKLRDSDDTHSYVVNTSNINTADKNITLPALTADDTFVFAAHAQTLTNKTMDWNSNTFQNFPTGGITANSTDTLTNKTIAFGDNTLTDVVSTNTTQSITAAKTFSDSIIKIKAPATANVYTIVSAAIAADRNITLPLLTGNDTMVTEAFTQTLTNKTLTSPVISSISNTGTLTLPTSTDTLVGRDTTDTLTNKTLTTPVISSISNTGTLTLPTSTTTLVGRDTTDTLTNKTMDYNSNTFQNFPSGGTPYPDSTRAIAGYRRGLASDGNGLFGFLEGSALGAKTGTPAYTYSTTTTSDRKYTRFATSAANAANNGHSFYNIPQAVVNRSLNIKFKCKFRCVDSTAVRYFIGFSEAITVPPNTTTPLATGDAGYVFVYDVAIGSNFLLYRNDTSGPAPTALTIGAANANVHTIEFDISSANGARYSFDGGAFTSYETSDVPGTGDPLYLSVWVTSTTTAAKSLDIWYWYLEVDA